MNNWKTTLMGILTITAGVINAALQMVQNHPVNYPALLASLTAGWGLIHAADAPKA